MPEQCRRVTSIAVRTKSSPARHENMTSTQKYIIPVAGMKAVKGSDAELVDLPPARDTRKAGLSMNAATKHKHTHHGTPNPPTGPA